MDSLSSDQINLVKKVHLFFKRKISKDNLARLDLFYLCPFGSCKGSSKLIFFFNQFFALKMYFITSIKDFIKLFFLAELKVKNFNANKKYKKIVVNWGKFENFSKNGEFFDKHFNVWSNKCPEVLWYVIYMDEKLPKKINKNITLVHKGRNKFSFKTIKKVINTIIKKKTLKYLNQEISELSIFATFVSENFSHLIHRNLKKVLMPYEGQPFQNSLFLTIHKKNKKTQTVGYIHSFPIGLPTNLMQRSGFPKKIIINSKAQQYCLSKFFGWSKKQMHLLPSSRLIRNSKLKMKNMIFLPIQFRNQRFIISQFKELIRIKNLNLSKFKIKNHPSCLSSSKHLLLIKKLSNLISNTKHEKNYHKNLSIFIGTTGSVIEALERNIDVFQICEIPILEAYSDKIWKYIKYKNLNSYIFKYFKIKNFYLLNFGNSTNLYKKYI